MKPTLLCFTAILACAPLDVSRAEAISIHSPDQQLHVQAGLDDAGTFRYALEAFGKSLVLPSAAAIRTADATLPGPGWKLLQHKSTTTDSVWKPLWGKRTEVPDRHNQTVFELQGPDQSRLDITIRVYDDGLAFRYSVPAGAPAITATDRTEFHFAGDYTSWAYNHENHNKGPENISWIHDVRSPVITLQAGPDAFLAIHEADLRQGEPLLLVKAQPTAFRAMATLGTLEPGKPSPWRVLFCGRSPGALVDSHLIELLNPDPEGDFSWVKPGVATWDWRIDGAKVEGFTYGMNYDSWVRMIDFSAANGMKHLLLDANWYGPEFATDSDPVKGDKAKDVQKIIAYGKSKNIGVWLYLNDVGGRQFPLEETLAQYGEWGAAGVKYGFMNGSPEEKNERTRLITELCAKNKLLCNFHDSPVHPYGQMRTWPNAVTREFCFAQLDSKRVFEPKTFVTSVFVNMLAGPIDMNNGFFDLRQGPTTRVDNPLECPSTLVSEAARTLITFSGATIIPDIPEFYQKYPELLQFIASQQQPWRESKTLSGTIGEHIVMARQSAKGVWLVGAATNEEARELDVKLDFLPPGNYHATIVQDGEDGHYQTNRETHRVEKRQVSPTDILSLKLAPGGGACVILEISGREGMFDAEMEEPCEVTLHVDESKPGPAIPADFLGFSYEKNVLALDHFKPSNNAMANLMRNLGDGVLRFGGNYVEITRWEPEATKSFSNEKSLISTREIIELYQFARASGWNVIHGLNLGANDPQMAAGEAAAALEAGAETLIAFEIGNEPELYAKKWRPAEYSYQDFSREVSNYLEVMRPKVARIPLCGPGTTSNFPWFSGFLRDFRDDLVITTRHNYPLAAATTDPANPRFATIENLLSPTTAAEWRKLIGQHQQASKAAGFPFRVTEAGSASSGGKPGVSDVFASALWCADYLFDLATLGVSGVNFHGSFNCRGYTSFCALKDGGYHAHANYYGMLFFRQAAHGRIIPIGRTGDGVNLTAYAVLGDDGALRIAIINKDLDNHAKVGIMLSNRSGQATVMRLNAPAVDAKNDITLGGAAVASDGTWQPKPPESVTASDGNFHIEVPAASAALLVVAHAKSQD